MQKKVFMQDEMIECSNYHKTQFECWIIRGEWNLCQRFVWWYTLLLVYVCRGSLAGGVVMPIKLSLLLTDLSIKSVDLLTTYRISCSPFRFNNNISFVFNDDSTLNSWYSLWILLLLLHLLLPCYTLPHYISST